MRKLTKEDILKFPMTAYGRSIGKQLSAQVVSELLQYKILEEQLGCPLDVVLKALKYGIYQEDGGRRKLPFIEYNSGTNKFYFGFGTYCNVEDYKKTWWLKENREE